MSDELRSRRRVLQATGVAIGGGLAAGTAGADAEEHDEDGTDELPTAFSAAMTDEEIPREVDTNASGTAAFELDLEARTVRYSVDVEWLCDPTAVEIRYGTEDEAGHELVQLYSHAASTDDIEGRFDGTLTEGTLPVTDLLDAADRTDLEAVATALTETELYVTVATESCPTGEIRGRIVPDSSREAEPIAESAPETESTDEASEADRAEESDDETAEADPDDDAETETDDPPEDDDTEQSADGREDETETVYGAPEDPDDE
ncbi:CHRD domain-containing protein [Natronococcus occultus]|uniref:CHRD domain-containing protein n=1 Tax=Natronococcus occultus SP4 TaxID=694430 RepID=L0JUP9_9EURY|nr:CHRD domain-containing protein [Natronococcus occultus]AGB36752.1 CHRD domain-containing protein [Natronococcus occultus SP4]